MTEPLIVDPDQLNSASTILGKAAGEIPVGLPKLSVSGSDPLSLAIAAGAIRVEAPMEALPGIKADATSTAQKIGTAEQMYATTDQELAAKVKQHQFDIGAAGAAGGSQKSVTDKLLGKIADGKHSAGVANSTGLPGALLPDNADWFIGSGSGAAQTLTDKVAELTRKAIAPGVGDGASSASPFVKGAVKEMKNPFTFFGKELPSPGSRMGGGVGVILSVPAVIKDVGEGNMSAGQAIAREGAALVVGGAVAAPVSVIPVVGPPLAIVTGIVVGDLAAKTVDYLWEPLQEFGKAGAERGYKVGRLGRL